MIGKKCKISFPSLQCSSRYHSIKAVPIGERTNDRFSKTFPSQDGIDEYESNTSNKHDMLCLYAFATSMLRHMKRSSIYVFAHWK